MPETTATLSKQQKRRLIARAAIGTPPNRNDHALRYAPRMRIRSLGAWTLVGLTFVACAAFDSADSAEETGPSFDATAGANGDAATSGDAASPPTGDAGERGVPDGGEQVYGDPDPKEVACGGRSCTTPDQLCCASPETGCLLSGNAGECISGVPLTCDGDED